MQPIEEEKQNSSSNEYQNDQNERLKLNPNFNQSSSESNYGMDNDEEERNDSSEESLNAEQQQMRDYELSRRMGQSDPGQQDHFEVNECMERSMMAPPPDPQAQSADEIIG